MTLLQVAGQTVVCPALDAGSRPCRPSHKRSRGLSAWGSGVRRQCSFWLHLPPRIVEGDAVKERDGQDGQTTTHRHKLSIRVLAGQTILRRAFPIPENNGGIPLFVDALEDCRAECPSEPCTEGLEHLGDELLLVSMVFRRDLIADDLPLDVVRQKVGDVTGAVHPAMKGLGHFRTITDLSHRFGTSCI